jgi:hypothetical protein
MPTNQTSSGYPNIQIAGKEMIYWQESIGNRHSKPEQQCIGCSMVPASRQVLEVGDAGHKKR